MSRDVEPLPRIVNGGLPKFARTNPEEALFKTILSKGA